MEPFPASYTIGSHLLKRLRNFYDETSGYYEPGGQIRTTISWQIADLGDSYESESNPLLRLARTGFVMKRSVDLHTLMDEATAMYGVHETSVLNNWRPILLKERNWRMEVFEMSLAVPGELVALLEKDRCDALEVLTLLAYDYQKYAENVYTPMERMVITKVYNEIVLHSDICVISVPKWFIPRYEIPWRNHGNLWQNVNVGVMNVPARSDVVCQTAIWFDLNHPNVARLFGACHVGVLKFFVYEEAHTVTDNILWRISFRPVTRDLLFWSTPRRSLREMILENALGLQYLHERGIVCTSVTPDTLLTSESCNRGMICGGNLETLIDESLAAKSWLKRSEIVVTTPSATANVSELGLSIARTLNDIITLNYNSWPQRMVEQKKSKVLPKNDQAT